MAVAVGMLIIGSAVGALVLTLRAGESTDKISNAINLLEGITERAVQLANADWESFYVQPKDSHLFVDSNGDIARGADVAVSGNITDGLVGHWMFDRFGTATTTLDSSGNGNDGTLVSGPTIPAEHKDCKMGLCLQFDGVDDSVSVPHNASLDLTTEFTIMYWVLGANENAPSSYWPPMTKGSYQNSGWDSFLSNGSTPARKGPSIRLNDNTKSPVTSSVGCPQVDVAASFTHIAITVDLTAIPDVVCYVNGNQTGTGNFNSAYTSVKNGTQTLRIGDEGGRKIKGLMDDVRFYNRALAPEEVAQLANLRAEYTTSFKISNVERGEADKIEPGGGAAEDPSTQKIAATVSGEGISPLNITRYITRFRNSADKIEKLFDAADIGAPSVVTNAASNKTTTSATLNGAANPNGDAATGWFRYSENDPSGCDDVFGTSTGTSSLGSGNSFVGYSQGISGLDSNTWYYYCAIAENSKGKGFGDLVAFKTKSTTVVDEFGPGTHTWELDSDVTNITSVTIELWGAGGGGAGSGTLGGSAGQGGAGGGAYIKQTLFLDPDTTYQVVVGEGGAGGNANAGGNGGSSSFAPGDANEVRAAGGEGAPLNSFGSGGDSSGSLGYALITTGGDGGAGHSTSGNGGGGGGGGGTTNPGGDGEPGGVTDPGEGGIGGAQSGGNGGSGGAFNENGTSASLGSRGGGGGGAGATPEFNHSGGNGAGGWARITYQK